MTTSKQFTACSFAIALACVSCVSNAGANDFSWKDERQSAGAKNHYDVNHSTKRITNRIRFVNIEYQGPANEQLWDRAFSEAGRTYDKNDISNKEHKGYDHIFVSKREANKNRILGWVNQKTGDYGFVVVKRIEGNRVYYFECHKKKVKQNNQWVYKKLNWRNCWIGPNPNNYLVKEEVGFFSDWRATKTFAAIQLWKHEGAGNDLAAASFRLKVEVTGRNPYQ